MKGSPRSGAPYNILFAREGEGRLLLAARLWPCVRCPHTADDGWVRCDTLFHGQDTLRLGWACDQINVHDDDD